MNRNEVFQESALSSSGNGKDATIAKSVSGESSRTTTTRDQIKQWKEQLEASGNLAKTVVNIEVSTLDSKYTLPSLVWQ